MMNNKTTSKYEMISSLKILSIPSKITVIAFLIIFDGKNVGRRHRSPEVCARGG